MQQTNNSRIIADKNRQGIALIMVLGVLTIITLLAVSFAISMRTERLAAENYVYAVKARHLLNHALARAVFEADDYLGGGSPMMYPDFSQSGPPLTNCFVSFGSATGPGDFLYGEVTNFIPRSVWEETKDAMDHVKWAEIKDPKTSAVIGRFAYLAINCSGLLDANLVAGLDRGPGTNTHEITITSLDDVSAVNTFITARETSWIRFETLPELLYVDGLSPVSSNFFVYSRFIDDNLNPAEDPKIRLDQAAEIIADKEAEIIQALTDCDVPNPNDVFLNLIDYVDTDYYPGNKGGAAAANPLTFCTEPVPMINEVTFSNSVTRISTNAYEHNIYVMVETWYPFPEPPAGAYPTVTLVPPDLRVGNAVPNVGMSPDPSAGLPVTVTVDPPDIKPTAPHSFQMSTIKYTVTANPYTPVGPFYGLQNMTFADPLLLQLGGTDVDAVMLPVVSVAVNLTPPFNIGTTKHGLSSLPPFSCADPRINWLATHWKPISASPLATNAATVTAVGEMPNIMYVRNKPMESAAELGFLSVGDAWKTIALCRTNDTASTDFHPVLDYFVTGADGTVTDKGLVNVNSRFPDVLAAAFCSVPIEQYPGDDAADTLSWPEAKICAEHLVNYLWDDTDAHEISNDLSRIGAPWEIYNKDIDPLDTDARRESVIRNTHKLLGVRQNLFTVILAAQVSDSSGTVFGEQRAVAVVWRDPVADASGNHPSFVRFFKLLAE